MEQSIRTFRTPYLVCFRPLNGIHPVYKTTTKKGAGSGPTISKPYKSIQLVARTYQFSKPQKHLTASLSGPAFLNYPYFQKKSVQMSTLVANGQ